VLSSHAVGTSARVQVLVLVQIHSNPFEFDSASTSSGTGTSTGAGTSASANPFNPFNIVVHFSLTMAPMLLQPMLLEGANKT
jgi:hypothetical protein